MSSKNNKGTKEGKVSKKKIVKDENAPKRPQNAYTIFFKHYVEHYNKKNPGITLDPRELISQIAKAWRGLSENDRSPFQELAQKEKDRYSVELENYKKSAGYKNFIKKQDAYPQPDVNVFSKEFIAHNKAKETELRQIRKEISAIDDKAAPIVERIGHLHAEIRKEEKSAEKKRVAERERLMVEWVRKMIPELQRAKILEELGLSITSTPEEFIEVMESYYDDEITMGKLRSAFNKFYLPINAEG